MPEVCARISYLVFYPLKMNDLQATLVYGPPVRTDHGPSWCPDSNLVRDGTGSVYRERQGILRFARNPNLYAAELRDKQPDKFGFFASLPVCLT